MTLTIRPAIAADASKIIAFIKALAAYEKLGHEVKAIEDFTFEDFEFVGYDPHPHIKAAVSV